VEGPEFLDRAKAEFERAREEERADAPFHHRGEVPELDRWEDLGYPPVEEIFARHPAALGDLVHWLGMETLDRILPYDEGHVRDVVNSLDRVTVADGVVRLEGRAYEKVSHPTEANSSPGVVQGARSGS